MSALPGGWHGWLQDTLDTRQRDSLLRRARAIDSPQGPRVQVDGRWLRNFCSNDYLELAEALADWLGVEAVLLFGNGYLANLGLLQGLLGAGDAVFQDRLNHASLLDGGLASGARQQRYAHADVDDLARR